uniref:Uncharacterized protein n=1 Tax=Ralstonia solanacearum TaxID=305 RepID=A0A0S4TQ54_RALSL|nr:protein of unknown function [Ralstonia solanacearum]
MSVHPSGYNAWHVQLQSSRVKDDQSPLGLIEQAWREYDNPTRRHSSANGLSPVEFEQRHPQWLAGV